MSARKMLPPYLITNLENSRTSLILLIQSQSYQFPAARPVELGTFKLLSTDDPAAYPTFKQALVDEHKPATQTESILVNAMAESRWLAQRAQGLQDTCMDSATGVVTDEKKFYLYTRYHTTHTRAFHKSLHDLLKLRSERRRSEIGFEAQTIAKEKHEMKKQSLYRDVLKKDVETCQQLSNLAAQNFEARKAKPRLLMRNTPPNLPSAA